MKASIIREKAIRMLSVLVMCGMVLCFVPANDAFAITVIDRLEPTTTDSYMAGLPVPIRLSPQIYNIGTGDSYAQVEILKGGKRVFFENILYYGNDDIVPENEFIPTATGKYTIKVGMVIVDYGTDPPEDIYRLQSSAKFKVVSPKAIKNVKPAITCERNDNGRTVITCSNYTGGITRMLVYRADKKGGKYKLISTAEGSSYTDTRGKALKKYYYKVRLSLSVGSKSYESKYSDEMSCAAARPLLECERPAKNKVKLTCSNKPAGVKMEVYRATSKNGKYKLIKTVKKSTYTDSTVKAKKVYYYKVRWTAKSGKKTLESRYSKIIKADKYQPAQVPEITSVTKLDNGKLRIKWRCNKKVDCFYVWISEDPDADKMRGIADKMFFLAETGSDGRSVVIPPEYDNYEGEMIPIKSGKTYYFFVYGVINPEKDSDLPTKLHSKAYKFKMP